jgi:hypothetical protein
VEVVGGPNRISEALDGIPGVTALPRSGLLEDDMHRLLAAWRGETPILEPVRERVPRDSVDRKAGWETSTHLARLWARDRVEDLLADAGKESQEEALALATAYRLVTPVSGAVVLESQQQYDEAGLTPVDEGTVPTIPEPGFWLLLAALAMVLLGSLLRRRIAWQRA